jgi:hypothetical protein
MTMRQVNQPHPSPAQEKGQVGFVLVLLVLAFVFAAFYQVRYGFKWVEIDSAIATNDIRAVAKEGTLETQTVPPYPNGFAYQAFVVFLVQLSGLTVVQFQQLLSPFLLVLLPLVAWLAYRELTGSTLAAFLAVVILLVQPEFLFGALRGTHEKLTRIFMFLCLFFFLRSYHSGKRLTSLIINVALFYLSAFGLISTNNLLANSFFVALLFASVVGLVFSRWQNTKQTPALIGRRLILILLSSILIVFIFTFYLYPPATHDILVMKNLTDRLAALLLGFQPVTNAYYWIMQGWVNLRVYFLVSLANWLLLLFTVPIWLAQGYRWYRDANADIPIRDWLLWVLFGGFVLQGALSIVIDASGFISSNLQHRLFPSFAMLAAALAARVIADRISQFHMRKVFVSALVGLFMVLSVLSLLKAVNEPMLSNKWVFYQKSEMDALRWTSSHLESQTIWADFDERLQMAYLLELGNLPNRNQVVYNPETQGMRNFLISEINKVRSLRLQVPLPDYNQAFLTYDNGTTQLYHRWPETPFQK